MPRSRLLLFCVCVAGISGCARDSGLVFVDLDKLADKPKFAPIDGPAAVSAAPVSIPSKGLGSMPERQLYVKEFAEKLKEAEKKFEADRQALYDRLRRELEDTYLADVRRIEKARRASLAPDIKARLDEAFSKLRAIFEKYANQKFGPLVRLTAIVGFPDPDSGSKANPDHNDNDPRRLKEAEKLRGEIVGIDRAYREEVRKLLDAVLGANDEDIVRLKADIVELEAKALREAELEAKRLAFSTESMLPKDAGVVSDRLPAIPAESIMVKNPKPTFKIQEGPTTPIAVDERQWLENDLKVWLANKGYRLTKSRHEARDATREFAEWRRQFQIGP